MFYEIYKRHTSTVCSESKLKSTPEQKRYLKAKAIKSLVEILVLWNIILGKECTGTHCLLKIIIKETFYSNSKAGRTATDKRSWIFTPKEMTKSAFKFLLLFRTPAETTHVPRMHLAWMAFPRKATRVNVNWDLQAAIVRKVRTQASWPTVWTVCHYPCALFSTDPSRFALQEDARVKEYSPQ